MSKSRIYKVFLLLITVIGQLGLQSASLANSVTAPTPLKVGFVLCGAVTDYGWNQAHNDGRLYLEKSMHGKVQTVFAESVPENSEASRVMEKMIAQGTKIIFATSYGYFEPVLQVATRHPDVIFMQVARYSEQKRANVGIYFPHNYEPLYVTGIVAGRMTKSNKVGYIVGHAVPGVLAAANAFTMGARSVNPKIVIRIVCTNSWNNPVMEAETTKALAESGADIVVSNLDSSLAVSLAAEKAKIYSIGVHHDLNAQVPKAWLTGQSWNFGPLYEKTVREIMHGSWKPITEYYTAKDGYTQLAGFGVTVPQAVRKEASLAFKKIKEGKTIVFAGPIKDSNGKLRIPVGKSADNHCIEQMNWVVPGVEGYLSK